MDPLAEQSILERWRLRRRLKKAYRQGTAEQHAATLGALRTMTGNDLVVSAGPSAEGELSLGEVVFASGATVRLAPCSRSVVRRLAELCSDQVAVLERAADHGPFWGLYFSVAGQRVGLLARQISVTRRSGGQLVPEAPSLLPA